MTSSPIPLDLRPADEADVLPLARLWALVFPGEKSVEIRARELREGGRYGGLERCWVARQDGRIAGAFRAHPFTMYLFGRPVPTLGLAAVAVDPSHRRRGFGAALCRAALRLGRERGDLLAALFPFRVDFYARLGFTITGELHRYRFPPSALPPFPGVEEIQSLPPDQRRPGVPSCYEGLLSRSHGLLSRSPAMWGELDDEEWILLGLSREAGLVGYMMAHTAPRSGRQGGRELRVRELVVGDADGYRAFLGWISRQRDQWEEVVYDALPGERLHQVLTHPRLPGRGRARGLWFPSATLLRGPMLRILDLPGILDLLGMESGAALTVVDEVLEENSGHWLGTGSGPPLRQGEGDAPSPGALPIGLVTGLAVEGELPGLRAPRDAGFDPPLGIRDFRLLDTF